MIRLTQRLLSEPKAKEIGEWLRDSRGRDYLEFLAALAAEEAAQAGNAIADGSENSLVDAKSHGAEAKRIREMINTLREHAAFDYKFKIQELQSTPPIKE